MAAFELCTAPDVVAVNDIPTDDVERLIPLASRVIQTNVQYGLNRMVERTTYTDELNTSIAGVRVYVNNPPAWSVSALSFFDGTNWTDVVSTPLGGVPTGDYTIDTDADLYGDESMGEVTLRGGYTFPRGRGWVKLTYDGGLVDYTEGLPLEIRTATAHLVAGLYQFEKRKGSAFQTRTLETGETVGFFEKLFTPYIRDMIAAYRVGRGF